MLVTFARRLLQRAPRGQRGMAGHGDYPPVPKPDTSMDHVFGDSSYKVDFDVRMGMNDNIILGNDRFIGI